VVYASNEGFTYALDQDTGALLTTLPVGNDSGGPVVVNGAVFIGDYNDGVLARYTPNALLSNFVAPRPDPMQLRLHHLH
jgi:outer membrane protein assembly factor BamB